MGKAITKNLGGRPTKMSEDVTTKLESIFKIGGTIAEAVTYAGISDETYRRWMHENEGFMVKMQAAQHYADVVAKNVVVDSMIKDRDISTAKWWLEKRQFRAESPTNIQVNVQNVIDKQKEGYQLDE